MIFISPFEFKHVSLEKAPYGLRASFTPLSRKPFGCSPIIVNTSNTRKSLTNKSRHASSRRQSVYYRKTVFPLFSERDAFNTCKRQFLCSSVNARSTNFAVSKVSSDEFTRTSKRSARFRSSFIDSYSPIRFNNLVDTFNVVSCYCFTKALWSCGCFPKIYYCFSIACLNKKLFAVRFTLGIRIAKSCYLKMGLGGR